MVTSARPEDLRELVARWSLAEAVTARTTTADERDELIQAVCRAAAQGERDRIAFGRPEPLPAPLPESTLRFLQEAARRARRSTGAG